LEYTQVNQLPYVINRLTTIIGDLLLENGFLNFLIGETLPSLVVIGDIYLNGAEIKLVINSTVEGIQVYELIIPGGGAASSGKKRVNEGSDNSLEVTVKAESVVGQSIEVLEVSTNGGGLIVTVKAAGVSGSVEGGTQSIDQQTTDLNSGNTYTSVQAGGVRLLSWINL